MPAAPTLITPAPSPVEAAAIVAAIERHARDTAAGPRRPARTAGGWLRAARAEAVGRTPERPAAPGDWRPWDERARTHPNKP
jgi:hypothetical protein